MSQTSIESATMEDIPQLADLLVDLFSLGTDFAPDHTKQIRGLRLILEQPSRGRIFILRNKETILGMINILFTISTAEGGFVALLEDLVIHRDYRGQDFGHRLLTHAIDYCREKEFLRITIVTDRGREDAARFFRANGFSESNLIVMRKLLAPPREKIVAESAEWQRNPL
jgi:GNAT superfamily N-acetyltransferase